jgi:hypothetical protein
MIKMLNMAKYHPGDGRTMFFNIKIIYVDEGIIYNKTK